MAIAVALQAQPPPPRPVQGTSGDQVTGAVNRYVLNPRGEVDGLLLDNGTQIKFPPHMSADLTSAVKPSDRIMAQGQREVPPVFTAFTITNAATGASVNESRPTQQPQALPPDLRGVDLKSMQADGRIAVLLHAPRGEVEGAILDEGTIIRVPPHISAQFASLLQIGNTLSARGYGSENQFGRCFETTELGATGQALTAIYSAAPPPPRAGP